MQQKILTLALLWASILCISAGEPILYWQFDSEVDEVASDSSDAGGNVGQMSAARVTSPAGHAAQLNGSSATRVNIQLPDEDKLSRDSWTVMAWVYPERLAIESEQKQRRLISYGVYPQSYFCIDLLMTGQVSLYEINKSESHQTTTGLTSSTPLQLSQWAHVAVSHNREAGVIEIHINGRLCGRQKIATEHDPDFSTSGEFSVGSGWQNYDGLVDEVRLYRGALSTAQIKDEFERLQETFGVMLSLEEERASRLTDASQGLEAAERAMANGEHAAALKALANIANDDGMLPHFRSYAHLRIAQSKRLEGQLSSARAAYAAIASKVDYPEVHRREAEEILNELDRVARGLPARDPADSQVSVDDVVAQHVVWVAPTGNDVNPGTKELPLASLQTARARVRSKAGAHIVLAPGEYRVEQTIQLNDKDSGTAEAPNVYRAAIPGSVVLYGGTRLERFTEVQDAKALERIPKSAHGHVCQLDLGSRGIRNFGKLAVRGFGQPASPPTLELYVDGKPMTLARWPNQGFVKPERLVAAGSRTLGQPSVLAYADERHARWANASDAWLFGYFKYLWADSTVKIGSIDSEARTLTTTQAYEYNYGGMEDEQGIIYYAFNLLEELDRPGEWYLDRDSGILYLYPPVDLNGATVELSMLDQPMITARNVAHVRFEGLIFDLGRGDGIVFENAENCQIVGCTVRRMAGSGIQILGGHNNTLLSCDVYTIGRRATVVKGGNRKTLAPGGHVVANCRIHDFGRIDRTYTPGVQLEGVGNRVAHNLFFNSPSSVMRIEGNDHLIEFNEVRDAVLESDDQGAMELYGNPTYRGVVFRHNLFERIGIPEGREMAHGQAGIRFDDAISGMLVYGNLFINAANGRFGGIQMNAGRDNIIDNNLFVKCTIGISGGYYDNNRLWRDLREGVNHDNFIISPLYQSRYPTIVTMLEPPAFNSAWRNVFYQCGSDFSGNEANLDMLANLTTEQNPGFASPENHDFQIVPGWTALARIGFHTIPVKEIGLYKDQWRPDGTSLSQ
jgi:parallel beta-helix repeat protein